MIYSVWQPGTHMYRYYEVPEAFADETPRPRVTGTSKIGLAPEEISWQLPQGARLVGSGPEARGVVVHVPPRGSLAPGQAITGVGALGALGGHVEAMKPQTWLGMVVAGYFIAKGLDTLFFGKKWGS